jgi:transposase-like protein
MGMTVDEQMSKAQKLKICDVCKLDTESKGGIDVRAKWYCARCWMKFSQQRGIK